MTRYRHTLRLAGRAIPIYVEPRVFGDNGRELVGQSCYNPRRKVRLAATQQGINRAEVLLHEALHQASELYAVKLTERQTLALEAGIVDLIRSNPWLVRLIQGAK